MTAIGGIAVAAAIEMAYAQPGLQQRPFWLISSFQGNSGCVLRQSSPIAGLNRPPKQKIRCAYASRDGIEEASTDERNLDVLLVGSCRDRAPIVPLKRVSQSGEAQHKA